MNTYCFTCMNEIPDGGSFCPHCQRENIADNTVYRLKPGTILNKKFLIGNCLGEGGFGITYIGRDLTLDRRVAVKEYFPNGFVNRNNEVNQLVTATTEQQREFFQKGLHSFLEEARNIAKLTGVPGIVDVREYFEENCTAYIIMEYLDGINLSEYMKQNGVFAPETIFELMLPITYSLQKMHEAGIIHRDISPDNIMYLYNGTLKLMDFGSARYFTNADKEMSVMLKQGYAPEEQYRKNGDQGPWTDVYGLCATMYKCVTGKVPAQALDRTRSDTLIPPSALGVRISEQMQNTLLFGLAVYKDDRCQSMQQLSYMMEKALNSQNIIVDTPNYYHRVNQTMLAEEAVDYRDNYTNGYQQNTQYTNMPPQNGFYDNRYQNPPQKSKSSKTPIIIAIVIFLCVAVIAATAVFLVIKLNQDDDSGMITITETTASQTTDSQNNEAEDETSVKAQTEQQKATEKPTQAPATTPKPSKTTAYSPSQLGDQQGHNYAPDNVLKNDNTCWCPKEGSGVNSWIRLDLPQSQTLNGLDIINGYAGTEDQYNNNGKPTQIKIEFSDGSTVIRSLDVYTADKRNTLQHISFSPVNTSSVKITILSISKGKKWEDTCITYISPSYN